MLGGWQGAAAIANTGGAVILLAFVVFVVLVRPQLQRKTAHDVAWMMGGREGEREARKGLWVGLRTCSPACTSDGVALIMTWHSVGHSS